MLHLKRTLCILTVMVLLFGGIAQAEYILFNTDTSILTANLTISSGKASLSGYVKGSSTKYAITGTLSLQQKKNGVWATIKTWPTERGTGSLQSNESFSVTAGQTYRTQYATNVNGEKKTKYSSERNS